MSSPKFMVLFSFWTKYMGRHARAPHEEFSWTQNLIAGFRNNVSVAFQNTKKLWNPFSSLEERVFQSLVNFLFFFGFSNIPTHFTVHTRSKENLADLSKILGFSWNLAIFRKLVLQDYWTDFKVLWCFEKLEKCSFWNLQPGFAFTKTLHVALLHVDPCILFRNWTQPK